MQNSRRGSKSESRFRNSKMHTRALQQGTIIFFLFLILSSLTLIVQPLAAAPARKSEGKGIRLKNIARILGMRTNQLLGYGIVVGLPGTGDSRSRLASRSIRNLLAQLGQKSLPDDSSRNIAAVLVTAELPGFARRGDRIDAMVSSIGDARSLSGGVLIRTPLRAGDGITYAAAQGIITQGGGLEDRGGRASGTVGIALNGAHVEKDTNAQLIQGGNIRIKLFDFDLATLESVRKAVIKAFPGIRARSDNGELSLGMPSGLQPYEFLAQLEDVRVNVIIPARVIINERTGTVVMGGDIRVDPVAVTRGNLKLYIVNQQRTSNGISKELNIKYGPGKDSKKKLRGSTRELKGANISEIVSSLNAMGASVKDVIAVLEALKKSGALHARLIVH